MDYYEDFGKMFIKKTDHVRYKRERKRKKIGTQKQGVGGEYTVETRDIRTATTLL